MVFPISSKIISRILPQKPPFLFVDKVLSFEPGKSIVTCNTFSVNEWFFQGHFPLKPVVPGVLLVENMAQSSGLLFGLGNKDENCIEDKLLSSVALGAVNKMHFKKAVFPGDYFETQINVIKIINQSVMVEAKILMDGIICVKGSLSLSLSEPN